MDGGKAATTLEHVENNDENDKLIDVLNSKQVRKLPHKTRIPPLQFIGRQLAHNNFGDFIHFAEKYSRAYPTMAVPGSGQ